MSFDADAFSYSSLFHTGQILLFVAQRAPDLTLSEVRILIDLCYRASERGTEHYTIKASVLDLMKSTGYSLHQISETLQKLENRKLILMVKRGKASTENTIFVTAFNSAWLHTIAQQE